MIIRREFFKKMLIGSIVALLLTATIPVYNALAVGQAKDKIPAEDSIPPNVEIYKETGKIEKVVSEKNKIASRAERDKGFRNTEEIRKIIESEKGYRIEKNTNGQKWKLHSFKNVDDLTIKILTDKDFIFNWASIANKLGFAWCAGTNSSYVGEDFSIKKTGDNEYTLMANYNPSDPYIQGHNSTDRLKIKVSNIKFLQEAEVSYKYMSYDITLEGFLKEEGNARVDHPTDRPHVSVTFGDANKGKNAVEFLKDIYENRHIPGYSQWDFNWIYYHYGINMLNNITKYRFGGNIEGVFKTLDGTEVEAINSMIYIN